MIANGRASCLRTELEGMDVATEGAASDHHNIGSWFYVLDTRRGIHLQLPAAFAQQKLNRRKIPLIKPNILMKFMAATLNENLDCDD